MKKIFFYIFPLMLVFIINCHPRSIKSAEETDEVFAPMRVCTEGRSIDDFLARFKLEKVNKIVLKVTLDEDTTKTKTLKIIDDKEKVISILSAIKNVKCLKDFVLSYCGTEFWLYENNKLRLKVALAVDKKDAITRFYKPKQVPSIDRSLGENDFLIVDEKLCSWLYELIRKELNIPMED